MAGGGADDDDEVAENDEDADDDLVSVAELLLRSFGSFRSSSTGTWSLFASS